MNPSQDAAPGAAGSSPATSGASLNDTSSPPLNALSRSDGTLPEGPWNVPHEKNNFFTGREQVILDLHASLTKGDGATVLHAIKGLGGVGKTQTAVEYVYRYRNAYKAVLWTGAESELEIRAGFADIAQTLDLTAAKLAEQNVAVEAVKRWLEAEDDWLLIFDNANTPEFVKPFRPRNPRGHVLLTSRAHTFDTLGIKKPIEITELPPDEAFQFFLKRTRLDQEDGKETQAAQDLALELGYLPLAMEQAGAYILAQEASFQDYLTSYRKHHVKLLERQGPVTGGYDLSVAKTWDLNFREVEKTSEAAADLLRVSAFLAPDNIPLELIRKGASELGEALSSALSDAENDPLALTQVLGSLLRYSLVRREGNTYSIHRLVQAVLQDDMDTRTQATWVKRIIGAVDLAMPESEFTNWPFCNQILPHALICATRVETSDEEQRLATASAGRLFYKTGKYLLDRGRYEESAFSFRRAVAVQEETLGSEDAALALSLSYWGILLSRQAKYAEALPIEQQALAIREKALNPEHSDIGRSLNCIAFIYTLQGRYSEAEPLYQRSLTILEKALGLEHPDTAAGLGSLAALYQQQGRYSEAEPLYQRALAIWEEKQGPEHPDTAGGLSSLATLYLYQGRYGEAEPLCQRSLSIREKVLGMEHPDMASGLNNLAALYQQQGRYSEAEPLHQRALLIWEWVLGPTHPDVAGGLGGLASLYHDQGRYGEAEPLYQRALAIWEEALGPAHPNTATGLSSLAALYQDQGRYAEAEPLCQRSLSVREKALGMEHPDTANSLNNLGMILFSQRQYGKAEALLKRAVAVRKNVLGLDHPTLATTMDNYASVLSRMNRKFEAGKMHNQARAVMARHAKKNTSSRTSKGE